MGKFTNIVSAQITGNVGSMNFRRKDGEIVAAQRVTTNSSKGDGASYAQRLHRIRIANIANMYRAIALIEQRGWENKGANQSDFNMFSKFNLAASPVFLTKQEAALGAAVCAPYAVSRGTLTPTIGRYTGDTIFNFGVNIGADEIDWDTMSIPQLSKRIIENNKGWQYGDKLSACVCHQITRIVSGIEIPQVEVTYLEITLDADSTQLVSDMGNWDAMQLDAANDHTLQFLDGGDAAFVIHSRETAGKLLTSEQDMVLKNAFSELFMKYSSDTQRDTAMSSYGYKDAVLLDPNSENADSSIPYFYITSKGLNVSGNIVDIPNGSSFNAELPALYMVYGNNLKSNNCKLMMLLDPEDPMEEWIEKNPLRETEEAYSFNIEEPSRYRLEIGGNVITAFEIVSE